MAEGTSAPSYNLSGSTRRAVKEAGVDVTVKQGKRAARKGKDPVTARQALARAKGMGEVGDAVTGSLDDYAKRKEEEKTAEEAKALKSSEEANAAWDKGMAWMNENEGKWTSDAMFEEFQQSEQGYKDEFLKAVEDGDKNLQQVLLKKQQTRSTSLQGWKSVLETANKINSPGGTANYSEYVDETTKLVVGQIASGDAKRVWGKDGRMKYEVNGTEYSRDEVDQMIADAVYPEGVELSHMSKWDSAKKAGNDASPGAKFGLDRAIHDYKSELTKKPNTIRHIIENDWGGGGSFAEHAQEYLEGYGKGVGDVNNDGVISPEEAKAQVNLWRENPEEAIEYVAEWLGRTSQNNFEKGQQEKIDEANAAAGKAAWSGATAAWQDAATKAGVRRGVQPTPEQYLEIHNLTNQ